VIALLKYYKYFSIKIFIGVDKFGESAPAGQLFKEYGFTVVKAVKGVM
jgi:transketolase